MLPVVRELGLRNGGREMLQLEEGAWYLLVRFGIRSSGSSYRASGRGL